MLTQHIFPPLYTKVCTMSCSFVWLAPILCQAVPVPPLAEWREKEVRREEERNTKGGGEGNMGGGKKRGKVDILLTEENMFPDVTCGCVYMCMEHAK